VTDTPDRLASPEPSREPFVRRHRAVVGFGFAVCAAALTVVWIFVVPPEASVGGVLGAVVRLGHPLTWFLLSIVGLLHATDRAPRLKASLAYSSLASYAVFMIALVTAPYGAPS